jgi:hypothetical protein
MFGPDRALENNPEQIKQSLSQGFDCEVDVRYIDSNWILGHDTPDYPIEYSFLEQPGLWIHTKNLEALYLLGADSKLNFFWHQEDEFTLTSQGYIWTYPGNPLTMNSVCVMPEWNDPEFFDINELDCCGICSDYVGKIKELL